MTDFRAASDTRLLGPQPWLITEPTWDWSRDWLRIAARAQELVANDPFAAAMVACKLDNTHGPEGLRPVSLAQLDNTKPVSLADHQARETLERAYASRSGRGFDTGGLLTRREVDRQLDWLATVLGEGFAVRKEITSRQRYDFSTTWRVIRPERVSNPDGRDNDSQLYHGIELDSNGQPIALWVERNKINPFASWSERSWTRVPWYAKDGTPNVIHRVGWRLPGMIRGLSMFAPVLLLAKQIGGTIEAHVTAKRAQACNPVIYYVDDPAAAAKAARASTDSIIGPHTRFNPLQVYYAKIGSQISFTDTKFNGADLEAFLKISFRVLCAVWQLPIEVVLCQMGEASLSSARAGLDQVDRTAQTWQADHIEQASSCFEYATVSELVRYGQITPGSSGINGLLLSRYRRPPKYSTDRLKDANTIEKLIGVGFSRTSAFATVGADFEDETDQAIRDELYQANARKAAGVTPSSEDILREAQASIALISAGLSTWSIEIAKRGQEWGAVWTQLMLERQRAIALGLTLDMSGTNAPAPDSTVGVAEPDPAGASATALSAALATIDKLTQRPTASAPLRIVRDRDGSLMVSELATENAS